MRNLHLVLATAIAPIALCLGCTPGPVGIATLPADTLSTGLAAHWTFDEGVGLLVGDSSGNGRDGTLAGGGWNWLPNGGQFGGALQFGGSDTVSVPNFPQATPSFSVSAWLRFASTDFGPFVAPLGAMLSNETAAGGWALYLSMPAPPGTASYDFPYYVGPPQSYAHVECSCFTADTWIHLASVVDGAAGTLTLYVDGVARETVAVPRGISVGTTTLLMGRWPMPVLGPSRFLTGALDDVAIWTRALASEEITILRGAPAPNLP